MENVWESHGKEHPVIALVRSLDYIVLSEISQNMILSHMRPETPDKRPPCKEAWLLCVVDKICATKELLGRTNSLINYEIDMYFDVD